MRIALKKSSCSEAIAFPGCVVIVLRWIQRVKSSSLTLALSRGDRESASRPPGPVPGAFSTQVSELDAKSISNQAGCGFECWDRGFVLQWTSIHLAVEEETREARR